MRAIARSCKPQATATTPENRRKAGRKRGISGIWTEAIGRVRDARRIALDRIGVGLRDRVLGDARDMRFDRAVAGEGEGFDLDDRLLPDADKTDVAIAHI